MTTATYRCPLRNHLLEAFIDLGWTIEQGNIAEYSWAHELWWIKSGSEESSWTLVLTWLVDPQLEDRCDHGQGLSSVVATPTAPTSRREAFQHPIADLVFTERLQDPEINRFIEEIHAYRPFSQD